MTTSRSFIDYIRELWFALDTASALRHGAPVSENARRYCMTAPDQETHAVA